MSFYDRFLLLCKQENISPSAAATKIGLNNSSVSYWKRGTIPKLETIEQIAEYFDITPEFLRSLPPFDDLDSLTKYKSGVLEGLKHLCEKTHLDWYNPTDDISYWRLVGLLCSEIHFGPDGKKVYINMSPGAGVRLDRREHLSAKESELLDHFLLLNQQGQGKVIDYANDLLRNPDYQRFPDPPEDEK